MPVSKWWPQPQTGEVRGWGPFEYAHRTHTGIGARTERSISTGVASRQPKSRVPSFIPNWEVRGWSKGVGS
jgi:hypothetical protein